jgi:replication-associated recombination protein RarA
MTDKILLHKRTGGQLKALVANPSPAVMIIGPAGSGKRTVARYLAARLMDVPLEKVDDQPYYVELIKPDGKTEIPIDAVREVIRSLRLKTADRRRVVLIDQAHTLSEEAQNALLKSIEEPPDNTLFILTVITQSGVLPTIASRSRKLNVLAAGRDEAMDYFEDFDTKDIDSAWSLTRGSAGLMSAILNEKDGHELKQAVDQAKLFLRMDRFERLIFLDKLSADKPMLIVFLDALNRVYTALSDAAVSKGNQQQLKRLTASRRRLHLAMERLQKNVSVRLLCLDLALSLSP